ncbi:MAG: helix-turn-helix domain-containing protein [Maribacter sp.]
MVVFIALSNIQHVLIDIDFLSESNVIRKLYIPIQWLITPMFYFHAYEVVYKENPKKWVQRALLAPVALVALAHVLHFAYYQDKISIAAMPDYDETGLLLYINFISFFFHGIILYGIFKMFPSSTILSKKVANGKYKLQRWYLTIIIFFMVIVCVGFAATTSLIQFNISKTLLLYTTFLLVSFVGYYLGYVGVYRSTFNADLKTPNKSDSKNAVNNTYQKIDSYIIKERRYLDIDLNQSEIADKFNITPGYLSQLINTNSEQNFNDYINKMRIEASKKMLIQDQFDNYTIESIGLECGFKSKSNFYTAFKKFTGLTPKAYAERKKMRPIS